MDANEVVFDLERQNSIVVLTSTLTKANHQTKRQWENSAFRANVQSNVDGDSLLSKFYRLIIKFFEQKKEESSSFEKNEWKKKSFVKENGGGNGFLEASAKIRFLCYFSYFVLIVFGYLRIFFEWIDLGGYNKIREKDRKVKKLNQTTLLMKHFKQGYCPLYKNWQAFYTRYIYRRIADIFAQPISNNPGGFVNVLERYSIDHNFTFKLTGKTLECINLASYDYLGFSKASSKNVNLLENIIKQYGVSVSSVHEIGTTEKQQQLEKIMAQFLRVESCMVFGMGFATNSSNIPLLGHENCLIIADERSHASAKSGIHMSGAHFKYFQHNAIDDLERKIRKAICDGNKTLGKKWSKIIIIVEGVYSMEGNMIDLPLLIDIKKRYKCYLYIDEAHSIGAVGAHGRGVVDYYGCEPKDIDLLMGTMTKSFAASGGYIAGRKSIIDYIRCHSLSNYGGSMSAVIAQQVINTVTILMNENNSEGRERIENLLSNTHYMRNALEKLGFVVMGHYDSPVIPIMVYLPAKIGSIVRMAVNNGLALVCAGYPATSLTTNRIRLCMTASHCKKTLDQAIQILSKIGDAHQIKYRQLNFEK